MLKRSQWTGHCVLALLASPAPAIRDQTVIISFEQEEGSPALSGVFDGQGIPSAIVSVWTADEPTDGLLRAARRHDQRPNEELDALRHG